MNFFIYFSVYLKVDLNRFEVTLCVIVTRAGVDGSLGPRARLTLTSPLLPFNWDQATFLQFHVFRQSG